MNSRQRTLTNTATAGAMAGVCTLPMLAWRGHRESGSAIAPLNVATHVALGDAAAQAEGITLEHTLPGVLINVGAGFWWAAVFERLFGAATDRRGLPAALAGGAATAALAYLVDYRLLPRRLSPGWELRLSGRSVALGLAAMGFGIGLGAWLARRR